MSRIFWHVLKQEILHKLIVTPPLITVHVCEAAVAAVWRVVVVRLVWTLLWSVEETVVVVVVCV